MSETSPAQLVPYVTGGAFALAFIFGAVGNKTNFCTMGAVSDWVNMGDLNRMRMWLLAIAVALLGSSALQLAGVVDLSKSINHVVGGILMGFGGITALGCTIGQAITGISTLAVGSFITFAAILAGSALTMKYQYWRMT